MSQDAQDTLYNVIVDRAMAGCEGEHKHAYAVGRLSAFIAYQADKNPALMADLIKCGLVPETAEGEVNYTVTLGEAS